MDPPWPPGLTDQSDRGYLTAMIRTCLALVIFGSAVSANDPKATPDIIPVAFVDHETAPMPKSKSETKVVSDSPTTGIALEWSNLESIRTNVPNDFTLSVRNTTPQSAQRVIVQVRIPDGVTWSNVVPEPKVDQGILYWEFGTIEASQSRTIQLKLTTATKRDLTCQAWVTTTGTTTTKIAVREPKLDVSLQAPREVILGDRITLKPIIKNSGDDVLTMTTFLIDGSSTIIKELAPGQTNTVERFALATTPGIMEFELKANAEGGYAASDRVKVKVLTPKLTVALSGPTERQVGRKATYTVTVTNGGDVALKDVVVRETFPAEFKLASSSMTYAIQNSTATWAIGDLIPGQNKVFTYEATAICPGPATHAIKAVGSRNTQADAIAKTIVEGVPALRMELVDQVDPIEKNGETTYEIKLTNTGTKADSQVQLVCVLPAEMKFVSASGPTNFKESGQSIRFDPIANLAAKTEAVFRVKVKAVGSGDVRFQATVTTATLNKPVVKEESTRIYGE